MRWLGVWVLVLAGGLFLLATGEPGDHAAPASGSAGGGPPRNAGVLFVGNSVTAGIGDEEDLGGFVGRLRLVFSDPIANAGCSGALTSSFSEAGAPCHDPGWEASMAPWEVLVAPWLPRDVVFVMIGGNDARFGVSVDAHIEHLTALLTRLEDAGAGHLVLGFSGPLPLGTRTWEEITWDDAIVRLDAYRARYIVEVCPKREVTCVNVRAALDTITDFAPGDPHPNARGHQTIADILEPVLRGLGVE